MKLISGITSFIRRGWGLLTFQSSEKYWIERYRRGENSGCGSYGKLALYKADIVNGFVETNGISTIIEYGCGDGNQLKLAKYPSYIGFDISPEAIFRCRDLFKDDPTKTFNLMSKYRGEKAELTLSLDVIYHLVENDVFKKYMYRLFHSSQKYTIIYSTNFEENALKGPHIKHRHFTEWIKINLPAWELISHIPSSSSNGPKMKQTANADFFIYQETQQP